MANGYFLLLLHAHLPFVRHPEHASFLEEGWLFEGITETYIPILDMVERQAADGIASHFSMSFTPCLCEMLSDPLLQERYSAHLEQLCRFAEQECGRTHNGTAAHRTAEMYASRLRRAQHVYEHVYERNILKGFRHFQNTGRLEILCSAATHPIMPLMTEMPAVRAQLRMAVANYEKHFGRPPSGMWLPECAFRAGLDKEMANFGIRYFFIDSHGMLFATPRPKYGVYAPAVTPNGTVVFARDAESAREVWSSSDGYPGDERYREFYRDAGYDAPLEHVDNCLLGDGSRHAIGIKYHRITGAGVSLDAKDWYDPDAAYHAADAHATDFLAKRIAQAHRLSPSMHIPPVIVAPYDAELFGHWWYEGPIFLDLFLRKMACDQDIIKAVTPSQYLALTPSVQTIIPSTSTWGDKGYFDVWINESNDWIYPLLHHAERRMIRLANEHPESEGEIRQALNQAARELMLAQSSDWAFIMAAGTMVSYAQRRVHTHLSRFNQLDAMIRTHKIDSLRLAEMEEQDSIFPEIDYRIYAE